MNNRKFYPILMALGAAILFGASAPVTKILLGQIEPIPLAAFLYLGSGIGLVVFQSINMILKKQVLSEAPLKKPDLKWLLGAIIAGGVLAPIILLYSLKSTPASTASLLLNFETVATMLIAMLFFKEYAGRQVISAIVLITLASILLSWDFKNQWGISIGSLGIILACCCWGMDNNFTRNISLKNPFTIVTTKGIAAGSVSFTLALALGNQFPDIKIAVIAMVIGFFCYGLSIVLFVFAMRDLGSARTSALFGTAPFIGTLLSFVLLRDTVNKLYFFALPIMIFGAVLLLKENHEHEHKHKEIEHEHRHNHMDLHHTHEHDQEEIPRDQYHSHSHIHKEMEHAHAHSPDIHHRHEH